MALAGIASPVGSRTGVPVLFHSAFLDIDFWTCFCCIFDDFGCLLDSIFNVFPLFCASIFRPRIPMDFTSVSGWILLLFLYIFDEISVRARNLLNLQKPLFLQWICMILPFEKTWFLINLMLSFVTNFGIDLSCVLASILVLFRKHLDDLFMFFR